MSILSIENAIVERLATRIKGIKIEAFPDKPEKMRLNHPKGQILVHYHGSNYSSPRSTDVIVQDRVMKFAVTVTTRSLREHQGAYMFLEVCRRALTGYKIEGCKKMYPAGDEFEDWSSEDGIWTFGIIFMVPAIAIEEVNEEDILYSEIELDDTSDYELSGVGFLHGIETLEVE